MSDKIVTGGLGDDQAIILGGLGGELAEIIVGKARFLFKSQYVKTPEATEINKSFKAKHINKSFEVE